jgi:N-acetylglucosamine PTS system EIICBA or EIICB component
MKYLQNVGKSLMLPIAVLPAVAILVGIANAILGIMVNQGIENEFITLISNIMFTGAVTILDNLPVLFAVSIAYGMSKDKSGAAAVSGLVA